MLIRLDVPPPRHSSSILACPCGSGAAQRTDEALPLDGLPPRHSRPNLPNSLHLPHIRPKQPASTTMPAWMPSSVHSLPSATPSAGRFPHVRVRLVWVGGLVWVEIWRSGSGEPSIYLTLSYFVDGWCPAVAEWQ